MEEAWGRGRGQGGFLGRAEFLWVLRVFQWFCRVGAPELGQVFGWRVKSLVQQQFEVQALRLQTDSQMFSEPQSFLNLLPLLSDHCPPRIP